MAQADEWTDEANAAGQVGRAESERDPEKVADELLKKQAASD
jgi:hypothetical protein